MFLNCQLNPLPNLSGNQEAITLTSLMVKYPQNINLIDITVSGEK